MVENPTLTRRARACAPAPQAGDRKNIDVDQVDGRPISSDSNLVAANAFQLCPYHPVMRESDLHQHIYRRVGDLAGRFPQVVLGPGDDCALVRSADGAGTLLTVDQLIEHRHFTSDTPVDLIARKAVARSISDIAAMAGTPAWSLATGMLPERYPHARELTDALHRWAEHWGAPMVGGDIAVGPHGAPLALTVTVGGLVHPRRGPVTRAAAQPGDDVWVTGALGGSLASGRHLTFEPRVRDASFLADTLGPDLHAMIDLSDGLGRDAGRIAAASGLRIELDMAALPRHGDVHDARAALADGEDYELCCTVAPAAARSLPSRTPHGTSLTRIGRVIAGEPACFAELDGRWMNVSEVGWDHAG